jgi:arabinogalactan oligomer/maltooligosaccharide transport system permease protein
VRLARWFRVHGWRHLVMLAAAVFALVPIVFVASTAISPGGSLGTTGLWPSGLTFSHFTGLFSNSTYPFGQWLVNSLEVSLLSAFTSCFLSLCAAYAFSRMRFRGRRVGLTSLLLVQMFPQFLAVVAIITMFSSIGQVWPAFGFNSIWGLYLLYMGGALGVNTYLMKGFLDTVPRELDQAAYINGASHAQVFFRIVVPLARPIIAVAGLLAFIGIISEYILAGLFLQDPGSKTLAVGMYGMFGDAVQGGMFGMFAAGTLITAVPTVAVFLWLQRHIVSGLTAGSVKG